MVPTFEHPKHVCLCKSHINIAWPITGCLWNSCDNVHGPAGSAGAACGHGRVPTDCTDLHRHARCPQSSHGIASQSSAKAGRCMQGPSVSERHQNSSSLPFHFPRICWRDSSQSGLLLGHQEQTVSAIMREGPVPQGPHAAGAPLQHAFLTYHMSQGCRRYFLTVVTLCTGHDNLSMLAGRI